jgi:uncharacterized protein YraI
MSARRHARAVLLLMALSMAAMACNITIGERPEVPTVTASVQIIAPTNRSVVAHNATITLAAVAEDATQGVAQIEFFIDGVSFSVQRAESSTNSLYASVTWTPAETRGYLITAEAQRPDGSTIGEDGITVDVVDSPITAQPELAATEEVTDGTAPAATNTIPASQTPNTAFVPPTNTRPAENTGGSTPNAPIAPSGPQLRVTFQSLNIRAGPGTNYPEVGRMLNGDVAVIIGRNADRTWWVVQWNQVRGWVINNPAYAEITGDTAEVPLVAAPPTPSGAPASAPTQALAPTSTTAATADLVFDSVVIDPASPTANQTFNVRITVRNGGQVDAPSSLIRGVFQPGNEASEIAVPPLAAGASITLDPMFVTVRASGVNQGYILTMDSKSEVDEGANGEANNVQRGTYTVN